MINRPRHAFVPQTDPILSSIDMPFDDGFVSEKQEPAAHLMQNPILIPDETFVETDYKNKKFIFLDKGKKTVGGFSVNDFIKYVCMVDCPDFMKEIDCNFAIPAIEKYIGIAKNGSLQLHSHAVSPFMANIDAIAKLYIFLVDFQDIEFPQYMMSIDEQQQKKVFNIFCTLMYEYSFYFLQLITLVMQKEQHPDVNMNKILFQYACSAFMQITKILKNMTERKLNDVFVLQTELANVNNQTQQTLEKMRVLQQLIDKQNIKIDIMFEHFFAQQTRDMTSSSCENEPNNTNSNLSDVISLHNGTHLKLAGGASGSHSERNSSFSPGTGTQTISYLSDPPDVLVIE